MGKHKDRLPGGINPSRQSGRLYDGGKYGYLLNMRREQAAERQAVRDARTPQQQIAELDRRLGKGKGALKERARLAKLIANKSDK